MGTSGCIIRRLLIYDFRVLNMYLALRGTDGNVIGNQEGVPAIMSTSRSSTTRASKASCLSARDKMR